MDVVVENCSYIFDTSAIGQEPRCREAHGCARAAILGGRMQVLHGANTCELMLALSRHNIYKSKCSNKDKIDRINRMFQDGKDISGLRFTTPQAKDF